MVGKAVVFVVAALYALLADKTPTRISKAGVYAVFVTQSNDIGFGFPIGSCRVESVTLWCCFDASHLCVCVVHPLQPLRCFPIWCHTCSWLRRFNSWCSHQLRAFQHASPWRHCVCVSDVCARGWPSPGLLSWKRELPTATRTLGA